MPSDASIIKRGMNRLEGALKNIDFQPLTAQLFHSIDEDKKATKVAASKPDPDDKSEEACPVVPVAAAVAESSQEIVTTTVKNIPTMQTTKTKKRKSNDNDKFDDNCLELFKDALDSVDTSLIAYKASLVAKQNFAKELERRRQKRQRKSNNISTSNKDNTK